MRAETVVMKFGGTSVGSTERIGAVAKRVAQHIQRTKDKVVVVVSAMSGETDRLIELYRKVAGHQQISREYHQLVSSGEQVTAALTASALEREGIQAVSLVAPQVRIQTKRIFGTELIEKIERAAVERLLGQGIVPVVAGFQGVDADGGYTTLGRGGSDATAVALAAVLGSCRCIIFTDVDGVYSALPSLVKHAQRLEQLSYEEMLELASSGAKVLQARSVRLARKFKVPLSVQSSFSEEGGTLIVEKYQGMEDAVVSGITCTADQTKITLRGIADEAGALARIFQVIAEENIIVDMIVQTRESSGQASVSCTVPASEGMRAYETLTTFVQKEWRGAAVEIERNIAKLSVVGEGMRAHAGVASEVFQVLGREGINIEMVTTSEIMISLAIKQKYSELGVRALHEHFVEQRPPRGKQ